MNEFQTWMGLVALIFVLSVIVRAMQETLKPLLDTKAKTMAATTLWLGAFMLLAQPVVQCWAVDPPPQAAGQKTTDKKAADKKPVVKTPAPAAASGSAQGDAAKTETPDAGAAKADSTTRLENARIEAMDSNYASMSLRDCVPTKTEPTKIVCDSKALQVKVNDAGLRARLKQFHVGDHIRVDIEKGELKDLRGAWSIPSVPGDLISATCRLLVLAACALVLFGLAAAVTGGSPLKFIVGMDNRYSNSKFQVALWFWVAMSTYIATVVFRVWYAGWDFFGAVSIPQNLLVLSGLSAITYGGAKAITTAKADAAQHPVTPPGGVPRAAIADPKNVAARHSGDERFFQDLLQNDIGGFDFGDFQMLVVTFIAVAMYLTLIFHFLGSVEFLKTTTLPDVDTTILAGFGLGHGAYLAKKAGGDVGKS